MSTVKTVDTIVHEGIVYEIPSLSIPAVFVLDDFSALIQASFLTMENSIRYLHLHEYSLLSFSFQFIVTLAFYNLNVFYLRLAYLVIMNHLILKGLQEPRQVT